MTCGCYMLQHDRLSFYSSLTHGVFVTAACGLNILTSAWHRGLRTFEDLRGPYFTPNYYNIPGGIGYFLIPPDYTASDQIVYCSINNVGHYCTLVRVRACMHPIGTPLLANWQTEEFIVECDLSAAVEQDRFQFRTNGLRVSDGNSSLRPASLSLMTSRFARFPGQACYVVRLISHNVLVP